MTTHIYGIKNCDTMKKALKWLANNNIEHSFHDYKKQGLDVSVLEKAIDKLGWEKVINTRGTTWRKLPEDIRKSMSNKKAFEIAQDNASIIKRPMLILNNDIYLGFKENEYDGIFKTK